MVTQKLVALGWLESDAQICCEIIQKVTSVEELERKLGERDITLNAEQYILPVFRELYKQDQQFREEVRAQLRGTGLPDGTIDDYFTSIGDQPGFVLLFNPRYKNIPQEAKSRFIPAARETMFRTFKSYLEK